jgi:hypothetical protein
VDAERYGRADDVALRDIVGEHFLIVLHAGESKMFSLNGMGLWFWQRLEQPASKGDLLAAMTAEYDVGEPAAASEIDRFLQDLLAKGLVKRV